MKRPDGPARVSSIFASRPMAFGSWRDRLLKKPLLHFLLAGGLLFAVHGWLHSGAGETAIRQVFISAFSRLARAQFSVIPARAQASRILGSCYQARYSGRCGVKPRRLI